MTWNKKRIHCSASGSIDKSIISSNPFIFILVLYVLQASLVPNNKQFIDALRQNDFQETQTKLVLHYLASDQFELLMFLG